MKIRTFNKKLSIKDIRIKSHKLKQKLTFKIPEKEELLNPEHIEELKAKNNLINLLESIKLRNEKFIEKEEDLTRSANLLYKIPSFKKFFNEYSLNEKNLKEMLSFSEIIYSKKGDCLFFQDEYASEMYLFLKGELSLKYSKKIEQEITLESYIINEFNIDYLHSDNKIIFKDPSEKIIKRKTFRRPALKNSVKDLDFNIQKTISSTPRISTFHLNEFDTENECYKITSERFISQNNLISFTPHSIDCFISSEDSLVLVLDKKSFNMSLQKNFLKVDNEYKKFICTRLPFFTSFPPETLNLYFFSWIKIYPKLNEQIYSINEEANYFYLIYSGECANVINNKYINFYNKGSFFGLDSLFNPDKKYTNTIICKDPNTIIFRFNPFTFNEKISNLNKKNLFQFYSISFQNSNEFLQKYEDMSLRFEYNYFHLSKNFQKKKFKKIEEIANLLEKNPINSSSLTERNNKKRNNNLKIQKNLFLSLDNLNPSFIHKTNSYLNSIKNSFEKEKSETKKIKLKKKRSVIKLDKTNVLYLKKIKKTKSKKRMSNSIKSQLNYSKLKFKTLYLGKEIKSNRSLNKKISFPNSLKLYDDSESNTLYSSYADPTNIKVSFDEDQNIYNDVNFLFLTNKGRNSIFSYNNFSNRFKKTFNEKVELSVDKWIQTLNDSKKAFKTKHYNLPLISSIEFN